jgi:hypothetical protein
MNKEAKMYVKNVLRGRGFIIDLINTVLSLAILIMVLLNSIGLVSGIYFMHIFAFGAILTLLNCIKKVRAGSGFAVAFALLTVLLGTMATLCYMKL